MVGVWLVLLILILMFLAGLGTLSHGVTARHTRRDMCTLIPLATVCIVGIIHIFHYVAFLTLASNDPDIVLLKTRIQLDYTSINIVILSFLWRFYAMASLKTVQTMKAFVYFVSTAVGMVTIRPLFPNSQLLSLALSQQDHGMFKYSCIASFLCGLSMEYFMFYLPAFITMCILYRRSSALSPSEAGARNEDPVISVDVLKLGGTEDRCVKCETMSPFLDMVAAFMALMLLLVRPLYVMFYCLVHGITLDLDNAYCLFPFYVALCFVNVQCKRSHEPHNSLPLVCSGEEASVHVK
ncbi:uncharacterized protein LOC124116174 [Haliotis rufescens]|uniref:uncharacterized protein LOC124116174 n=1 Tax=Haliotis rufescens TaxID=6454 RepID=UPI001EAFFF20|nr:uncharacterized protein LOC124116174 [Haliotis rufescens]